MAAALEDELLRRGVCLFKGARAERVERDADGVEVFCDDGRVARGSHALLAIGSVPNSDELGLEHAGVELDESGYITINHHCQSNVPHIYAAGDVSGKLPLSSVAAMQGRKIAEHVMGLHTRDHRHLDYDKAASAIFTEPEIADVGLAEAEAFASGRKIRVTKVPFSANAKALINDQTEGIRQDPLRPGHRRGARGLDRRPPRRRADLGDRPGRHLQPQGLRHRGERAGPPLAVRGAGRRCRIGGERGPVSTPKERAETVVDARSEALVGLSHWLHAHPEVGFEEVGAADRVAGTLDKAGFDVTRGVCDLPTAFVATAGSGPLHVGHVRRVRRPAGYRPRLRPQRHRRRRGGRRPRSR